jgi:hypothetical protein
MKEKQYSLEDSESKQKQVEINNIHKMEFVSVSLLLIEDLRRKWSNKSQQKTVLPCSRNRSRHKLILIWIQMEREVTKSHLWCHKERALRSKGEKTIHWLFYLIQDQIHRQIKETLILQKEAWKCQVKISEPFPQWMDTHMVKLEDLQANSKWSIYRTKMQWQLRGPQV